MESYSVFLSTCMTIADVIPAVGKPLAYIGPGAGLSAIGALLAIVAGLVVGVLGFVWYPIKRVLKNRKTADEESPR